MSPPTYSRTLLVGLSGPSSSGKTTLARFLRTIFTIPPSSPDQPISISAFILHIDDFYKTDKDIPHITLIPPSSPGGHLPSGRSDTRTEQNWDCAESLDLPLLSRALDHVKRFGRLPDDLLSFSKEDQNSTGATPDVPEALLNDLRGQLLSWLSQTQEEKKVEGSNDHICVYFVDAFLLYTDPSSPSPEARQLYTLSQLLDLKLWVSCSRQQMLDRRMRRKGYVTLESFWEDPPGYVEDVVWPEFLREHAWLVRESDSGSGAGTGSGTESKSKGGDGRLLIDQEAAKREDIVIAPEDGNGNVVPMRDLVVWATKLVQERLQNT